MSADDWRTCPKCNKNIVKQKQDKLKKLKDSYGKIPREDYNKKIMALANGAEDMYDDETLREDYEIYMDNDGILTISYGCFCEKCGFEFNFDKKIPVKI